jgi:diguanylate cyclase (GGDEF)-like protein
MTSDPAIDTGGELALLVEAQRRLLRVSQGVLASLDPAEINELIAASVEELLPIDNFAVAQADWADETFRLTMVRAAVVDPDAAADYTRSRHPIGSGLLGYVFETGESLNLPDAGNHPRGVQMPGTEDFPEHVILVPLVCDGRVAGAVKVGRRGTSHNPFTAIEFDVVRLFATLASIALQNARRHGAVLDASRTDALTGLWNHGAFQADLREWCAQGRRFALALLDLDRFKALNDREGHQAGDALLREVGRALSGTLRDGDRAYRYGGDEFAVIVAGADVRDAGVTLARLVAAIDAAAPLAGTGVTASGGIACWPTEASTPGDLVERADERLYAVKASRGGRPRL